MLGVKTHPDWRCGILLFFFFVFCPIISYGFLVIFLTCLYLFLFVIMFLLFYRLFMFFLFLHLRSPRPNSHLPDSDLVLVDEIDSYFFRGVGMTSWAPFAMNIMA